MHTGRFANASSFQEGLSKAIVVDTTSSLRSSAIQDKSKMSHLMRSTIPQSRGSSQSSSEHNESLDQSRQSLTDSKKLPSSRKKIFNYEGKFDGMATFGGIKFEQNEDDAEILREVHVQDVKDINEISSNIKHMTDSIQCSLKRSFQETEELQIGPVKFKDLDNLIENDYKELQSSLLSSHNSTSQKRRTITKRGIKIPLLDLTSPATEAAAIQTPSIFSGTHAKARNSRRNSKRQTPRSGLNVKLDDVNNSFDDAFDPVDASARASRKDRRQLMEKVRMEEEKQSENMMKVLEDIMKEHK